MEREERTLHKLSGFKCALIASVLFAVAVLLQIYSFFFLTGGGEHKSILSIFWGQQIPTILAYAFIILALIRGKRDVLSMSAVIVLVVTSIFVPFGGMSIFIIPARLGLLAIVIATCMNCTSGSKSLAKQCFFVPAALMAVVAVWGWLFFILAGSLLSIFIRTTGMLFMVGSLLPILIEAAGMLFMAMWAVDGIKVQENTATDDNIYCDLVKHILLLIFTFGIWFFIWIYRMTGYLNQVEGEAEHNPTTKLLLCLFVPFYSIYWVYKSAQKIDKLAILNGIPSDLSTICLILAIFIGIIPPILMQDKVNEIITAENRDTHSKAYTVQTSSGKVNFGVADELKTYKELLDSGIITQEEFDAKKKQILNL